jgi:hypothetical protein
MSEGLPLPGSKQPEMPKKTSWGLKLVHQVELGLNTLGRRREGYSFEQKIFGTNPLYLRLYLFSVSWIFHIKSEKKNKREWDWFLNFTNSPHKVSPQLPSSKLKEFVKYLEDSNFKQTSVAVSIRRIIETAFNVRSLRWTETRCDRSIGFVAECDVHTHSAGVSTPCLLFHRTNKDYK